MGEPNDAITPHTATSSGQADGSALTTTAVPATPRDLLAQISAEGYRTTPDQETTGWPPGVPYIVGNEGCERFSFYGMKAILFVHLAALFVLTGYVEARANELARSTIHLFIAGVYALPMIGAIIADRLAGKYQTILYLSLVYCAGHAALALWEEHLWGMYLGLALIALGSGGIKPCVSANVGDQFGKNNWFRVRTVYQIFYFSINFGSFFATISIPRVKEFSGPILADALSGFRTFTPAEQERLGTSVAFGIPGVLMFLATLVFWMGRKKFVHVPAKPGGTVGLLDTLSSIALFMAIGHLFFTPMLYSKQFPELPEWAHWGLMLCTSVLFLALGLWVFSVRQQLAPDNGFLAIMLYTLRKFFSGQQPAAANGDSPPLARNRFWGLAVERFGVEATEGPVAVLKIISVFFLVSVFWALFDQHASSWIEQAKMMDLTMWGSQKVLPNEIQALNPLLVMVLIPLLNLVYFLCDRYGIRTPPLSRMTVGMVIASLSFVAAALIQVAVDAAGPGQVWFLWQVVPYILMTIAEVMVAVTALEFAYTQAPKRMKSTIMSFFNLTVALGNTLVALLAYFAGLRLVNFFWVFAALMAGAAVLFGIRGYFYVQRDYVQE